MNISNALPAHSRFVAMRALSLAGLCIAVASAAHSAPTGPAAAAKSTYKVLHNFDGVGDGTTPQAGLISDAAGTLYGTTGDGGTFGFGTVFTLKPPAAGKKAWVESVLHSFAGSPDGGNLQGPLALDAVGDLWGTATGCGDGCDETVFMLTPPARKSKPWGTVVVENDGPGDNLGVAGGALLQTAAGGWYGTTVLGGDENCGTVYELFAPAPGSQAWTRKTLHSFSCADGSQPVGTIVVDAAGSIFGATWSGGDSNQGVVYRLSPSGTEGDPWTETVLHSFTGGGDGGFPAAGLALGADGSLHGTTFAGGRGPGVAYSLVPPPAGGSIWTESVLHTFTGVDGAFPVGGLTPDGSGGFYGTASAGGAHQLGDVFHLQFVAGAWKLKVLHAFEGDEDGSGPRGDLLLRDGTLYGVTSANNAGGLGTIYSIVP